MKMMTMMMMMMMMIMMIMIIMVMMMPRFACRFQDLPVLTPFLFIWWDIRG